ncbi:MAG TPA: aminotransferase class I/II-fold pyridoxal phosphate-dependent enzyme [Thermoanaerobaculia bacterium]|nr:aminotransferase class I/II-fold pyridoxal phosphate-dependent enzyme [Thermoanaerobaculia bacterium]
MSLLEAVQAPVFARRVDALGTENAFKIGPRIQEVEKSGKRVIRCNIGEPDFALPRHIAEEVKRQIDRDQTHYVDPQGIEPLRVAIAKSVGDRRGLKITPDRVVVFPGAKPPIGFAQEAYCDPGDQVIYPSPGFPIYESFTRYVGAQPMPLHLSEENGFTFRANELEKLLTDRTKLLYLNFPSNPTGGVATRAQLEETAGVVRHMAPEQMRVYSDEVYEDILFDGRQHESIASVPGMERRTIIVSGVSKTYAWTGGRVGWAVFPTAEEAAVFRNLNINYFSCVPAYNQWGAKLAIESPESAPAIAKMVAAFSERRDLVVKGLNAIDGVTCHRPGGAFYVFPNISGVCRKLGVFDAYAALPGATRKSTSPATLFQLFLLYDYQVATLDRRSFGVIGSEGKDYLRISIATGIDDLAEAVRRIAKAAEDKSGFLRFMDERRYA